MKIYRLPNPEIQNIGTFWFSPSAASPNLRKLTKYGTQNFPQGFCISSMTWNLANSAAQLAKDVVIDSLIHAHK